MKTVKNVGALVFDLGGVIIDINFDRVLQIWAEYGQVDLATLKSRFSFDESYQRHERGEINFSQYSSALRQSLQIDLSDQQFGQGWGAIFEGEVPGVGNHLSRLHEKFPLYAFTNSNPTHQVVWERDYAEILGLFRTVFVSSTMRLRKPEPAAFEAIAQEINVPLQHILFFDDTLENIVAAENIGIQTVHVTGQQSIADATALLVPAP
jgi:putative hydrolase of the HAD superfamily